MTNFRPMDHFNMEAYLGYDSWSAIQQ